VLDFPSKIDPASQWDIKILSFEYRFGDDIIFERQQFFMRFIKL
jgi:hypothetical protein